jgi:hypothetical protein
MARREARGTGMVFAGYTLAVEPVLAQAIKTVTVGLAGTASAPTTGLVEPFPDGLSRGRSSAQPPRRSTSARAHAIFAGSITSLSANS